jgi:hypothetical protein
MFPVKVESYIILLFRLFLNYSQRGYNNEPAIIVFIWRIKFLIPEFQIKSQMIF